MAAEPLERQLQALGADIHGALQTVPVPMYVLDRRGIVVWLNDAASAMIPGAVGRRFTDVMPADQLHRARRMFALRILGQAPFTDQETAITSPTGERHEVEISSVPLKKRHQVVGVFGVIRRDRVVATGHASAAASTRARVDAAPARVSSVARSRVDDDADGGGDGRVDRDGAQPRARASLTARSPVPPRGGPACAFGRLAHGADGADRLTHLGQDTAFDVPQECRRDVLDGLGLSPSLAA